MGQRTFLWRHAVATAAFALCRSTVTGADTIDQRNDSLAPTTAYSIVAQSTYQSFTPQLLSISFVDMFMDGTHHNAASATAFILIHDQTPFGSVVGRSDNVVVPDSITDYVHFPFSNPVSITPGHVYVMEPKVFSGVNNWFVDGRAQDTYPGGAATFSPPVAGVYDLNFREGGVPEPGTATAMAMSFLILARRRRSKDVSKDCPSAWRENDWA